MVVLNLGCGTKISTNPNVINIDWSIYLRIKKNKIVRLFAPLLLNRERLEKLNQLPDNILVHDLSKGIPFPDSSIDVVYHSHLLEHLDKDKALLFCREIRRVLKPEGVHRVVVPDFEVACKKYIENLKLCETMISELNNHDLYIYNIIGQSVRKEAFSTSHQTQLRRQIENLFIGDARKRGETHQWMYDRFNLENLLKKAGFNSIKIFSFNTSQIFNWNNYGFDINECNDEYKEGSLYMESNK